MTKYLNFFESESGFTEAVEAGQLFFPNVSYTENDDTVHWNLTQPVDPVETPMLRMSFSTSTPGQEVGLGNCFTESVTAMEIDGTPVNYTSGGTYSIAEAGNHTAVYQFAGQAIPEMLFFSNSGAFGTFTSAEITSAVISISGDAFRECGGLSGVSIPDSVTAIGHGAFAECSGLTSVTIPDSVTSLGEHVFKDCTEMRSARIGSGITTIPFQTFSGCTSLQSVTLPDSLTDIDHSAFANCSSLYDVTIPSGVTRIGLQAFLGCSGLTAIYFNSETPLSLGANALDYTNDCPIYVPAASVEAYQQAWPAYASRIVSKHRITASVNDDSLGEVRLNQETASEGDWVDFHVDVFEMDRYQVSSVSITDGNGDEVEYEGDEYDYSFTMPDSDVTISVTIGEKPKYTVTVDSTDGLVTDVNFMSDDGQPSYREGEYAAFSFNFDDPDGMFQVGSAQASDCDGNSIEVNLEDEGEGYYSCSFEMPGCDVSVFITIEDTRPKYNITAAVNDSSLGEVQLGKETSPEGEVVDIHIDVFDSEANSVTSVTATDGNGDNVECSKYYYGNNDYYFTMPASDVTVSVEIGDKIPEYNVSASVNDDSLGHVKVARTPLHEGEDAYIDVYLNDSEQYQVSSFTVTDGNGNNVEYSGTEHKDYNFYYFAMPASDVTAFATIEPKQ